jgi:sugar phosphate isomerase/epimerase
MKIAVASYSFHGLLQEGMIDIFGYLESCKYRYHVDSADIWNGFLPTLDEDFLKKVKHALESRGLVLANLCVDGPHLWEDDPAVREQHYQQMLKFMDAAELLGAQTVRIDAGGRGETYTSEQLDYIVKRYQQYAQRAYDNGYKIGPENHWGTEVNPENMRQIVEGVDHPALGVLLHFRGNAGDALMAPWAMHTHISWDIAENCLDESLALLKNAGYQGCFGVEHHSAQHEYNRVAIQLARVRDGVSRL